VFHKRFPFRLLPLARPSVLGDGLPERLRSTLVALLGITGAVGLAMVALVLQQGFPLVSSGPIHEPPAREEALHDRIVVERGAAPPRRASAPAPVGDAHHAPVPQSPAGLPSESPPPQESATPVLVTGSAPSGEEAGDRKRPPAKAPRSDPRAAVQAPPAAPVEEPSATSSTDAPEPESEPELEPEPAPEPGPAPTDSTHPGNGNAYGKGNGNGIGNGGSPPGQRTSGEAPGASGGAPGHSRE
jgi:hypothetical protein